MANLLKKATMWVKKQTHGGLKKGLSASGIKSTLKGAAKNPLTYAALAPFALPALGGLGGVGSLLGKGAGLAMKGVGLAGKGAGLALKAGGAFRPIAKAAGKFMPKDLGDVMDVAEFAGKTYGGYRNMKRQDEIYNAGAPLRSAGAQGMLDDSRPDLSSMFAQPEQRYRRINVGSQI